MSIHYVSKKNPCKPLSASVLRDGYIPYKGGRDYIRDKGIEEAKTTQAMVEILKQFDRDTAGITKHDQPSTPKRARHIQAMPTPADLFPHPQSMTGGHTNMLFPYSIQMMQQQQHSSDSHANRIVPTITLSNCDQNTPYPEDWKPHTGSTRDTNSGSDRISVHTSNYSSPNSRASPTPELSPSPVSSHDDAEYPIDDHQLPTSIQYWQQNGVKHSINGMDVPMGHTGGHVGQIVYRNLLQPEVIGHGMEAEQLQQGQHLSSNKTATTVESAPGEHDQERLLSEFLNMDNYTEDSYTR